MKERLYKLYIKGQTEDYGHRFTRSGRLVIDFTVFFRKVYMPSLAKRNNRN